MRPRSSLPRFGPIEIRRAVQIARRNWRDWQDVFERRGGTILSDPARFGKFCHEYSVGRTIRAGTRDEFRRCLGQRMPRALRDPSGRGLDALERRLRPRFGTRNGQSRMLSVLSKVAAFLKPRRFIAWDRFAKRGLNLVLQRPANAPFETYADYIAALDTVWRGEPGRRIRAVVAACKECGGIEKKPAFQRRVLDVYLMTIGGRWSPKGRRGPAPSI